MFYLDHFILVRCFLLYTHKRIVRISPENDQMKITVKIKVMNYKLK